jgi:hypothetical protein
MIFKRILPWLAGGKGPSRQDMVHRCRAIVQRLRVCFARMRNFEFAYLTSTTHPGFLNAPPLSACPDAQVVIAGVAWDGATTNRPGSRFGPYAIRRASHMLCDGWHPHFGVSPAGTLADAGDLQLPNTSLAAMRPLLEQAAF